MSGPANQFRGLIQGLVQTAFVILGDAADAVVYTSVSASVYNPVTGTTTDTTTVYNFNGTTSRFGSTEVDNKVVIATDAKLLCSYLDLPVTPTPEDYLTVIGKNWKVQRVLGTVANASWTIHIREI